MRRKLTQNTLVVIRLTLSIGKHIRRLQLDAIGIKKLRSLAYHTLMLARGTPRGRIAWPLMPAKLRSPGL